MGKTNLSDTYFVLEQLPARATIKDCRGYNYKNLVSVKPSKAKYLPNLTARDFLRDLADAKPELLKCQSRSRLVEMLKDFSNSLDDSADCGATNKREVNLYCGTRDNAYQIIRLLDPSFKK